MKHFTMVLFAAALFFAGHVPAQEDSEEFGPQPTKAPVARARYEADLKAHKGNPEKLVLPGLVADRKAKTVEVLAECTGLDGREIVEFLLIDQGSSHGYEGLLWSFAKPSDVHRALEFIGLERGTPVNPAVPRIWADGDRVTLTVCGEDGKAFPIEELILDAETEETLRAEGFVFTGSIMVPPRDGKGAAAYAADVYDPRSVASIYNEPAAVLDVPRRLSQGEAYGRQVVNPEMVCEGGTLVTVVMAPAEGHDEARAEVLALSVDGVAGSTGIVCRLTAADGSVLSETPVVTSVLDKLIVRGKEERPPYVNLSFGENLPLGAMGRIAVLMTMAETMGMVRIKPPESEQLYYRAFTPNKAWRKPEGRPTQPWELHLFRKAGKVSGKMVWQEPIWGEDIDPTFKRHAHEVPDPPALLARLVEDAIERMNAQSAPLPAVLLIFVEPGLTYGELMTFIRPVLSTHGTMYVFLVAKETKETDPSHRSGRTDPTNRETATPERS